MIQPHNPDDFAVIVNGTVLFRPHPGQIPAIADLTTPNLFVYGPRGTGKSTIWRWMLHGLAMQFPGFRYLVVRREYTELEKTHLAELPQEVKALTGDASNYHATSHTVRYGNGSLGWFAACDSEADAKKLLGAQVTALVFDEAPELEWQWMARIRGSVRNTVDFPLAPFTRFLGNPYGLSIDELWDLLVTNTVDRDQYEGYDPSEWRAVFVPIEANPSVNFTEYWKQFVGLDQATLKAWKYGEKAEPGALFSLIATKTVPLPDVTTGQMVETEQPYHLLEHVPTLNGKPIDGLEWVRIACGYDHGFSDTDPAVCLWGAVVGLRVIVFHEQTWKKTVIKDICKDIVEFRAERPVLTYCDPSLNIDQGTGFTLIDHFALHHVALEPARNDRELFVTIVQEALNTEVSPGIPRVQIVEPACPMLVKTIRKLKGNPNNPRKLADSKLDHWVIALAYLLMGLGFVVTEQPTQQETDYNDLSQFRTYHPYRH